MALPKTHHYDTFREELAKAYPAFGHALWDPDPGEYPPVEVGDVGFIRQGKFHCLFNALYSEDHPSNQRFGVPEYHEQLQPVPNHMDRGALHPNTLYSYGVSVVSGGLEALATGSIGSAEVSFSLKRKQGAVLTLPVTALREDTLTQDHFREWIITHIDSWFAFTLRLRLGIGMGDIILVTGHHRTRSWSNITFNEVQTDSQFLLRVEVAGEFGASVNWRASNLRIQGAVPNHGPSGENQCIFIRGFRVKRTFLGKIPRIKAAAEPEPGPPRPGSEPEEELVSIPSDTEYQDPLHVLLEYIAKCAPYCEMALVHDDDLERIIGAGDGVSLEFSKPDVVMDYIERSNIEVTSSRILMLKSLVDIAPWDAPSRTDPFPHRDWEEDLEENLGTIDRIPTGPLAIFLELFETRAMSNSSPANDKSPRTSTDHTTVSMPCLPLKGPILVASISSNVGCGKRLGTQELGQHEIDNHSPPCHCPLCLHVGRDTSHINSHILNTHGDVLSAETLEEVSARDLVEFLNTDEHLHRSVIPQAEAGASSTPLSLAPTTETTKRPMLPHPLHDYDIAEASPTALIATSRHSRQVSRQPSEPRGSP
ncbi:hypothetical protein H4582DRAFT_2124596 [Lactarius indigo]|nr:hypothetical protein H4582DRAFT_2124596 [Lactarius indigo]